MGVWVKLSDLTTTSERFCGKGVPYEGLSFLYVYVLFVQHEVLSFLLGCLPEVDRCSDRSKLLEAVTLRQNSNNHKDLRRGMRPRKLILQTYQACIG